MFRQIRSNAAAMVGLLALLAAPASAQVNLSSSSLIFNVPLGSGLSSPQSVTATATTLGTFSAINKPADTAWLDIENNAARSGVSSTVWTFRVNAVGLAQGTKTTSLIIVHDTGFRQLDITINVGTGSGGTTLIANPTSLNFITAPGGSQQQSLTVTNVGAPIQYSVASNQSWLSTIPALSTLITTSSSVPITVVVNAANLGGAVSGVGQLTLTPFGGGPATIVPVNVTVSTSNNLTANPSALNFTYVAGSGGAAPTANLNLTALASGLTAYNAPVIEYTAGTSTGWLSINPSGAGSTTSNPGVNFTVTATPTGLAVGSYTGRISFSGPGVANTAQIPVSFTITGAGSLVPAPTSLNFIAQPGTSPAGQSLTVSASTGANNVGFTPSVVYTSPANPPFNWLTVGNAGVNLSTTSTLSVNAITSNGAQTLPVGEYVAQIRLTLTGTANFQDVQVRLTVTNNPVFTVSTNALTFTGVSGTAPAAQSFTVQQVPASGTFSVQFIAGPNTPTNIVSISPSIGTLGSSPTTVTISPSFVGLNAGTYTGTLNVLSGTSGAVGASQNIALTFNVTTTGGGGGTGTGTTDIVFPTSLRFFAANGSTVAISQSLPLAATGQNVNWTLQSENPWLTVSPTQGQTPATPTVTVNPSTLQANSTTIGSLLLTGTGTGRDGSRIFVQVDTNASPQATITPSALVFTYVIGSGVQPVGQNLVIASTTGAALTWNATTATTSGGSWLQVSPTAGTTNGTNLVATLNTAALLALTTAGTYEGEIQIVTSGGVNNTVRVPVRLILQGAGSGGGTGGTTLNQLVITPSTLSFHTQQGVNPIPQNILLINPSLTPSFSASATTTSGGNWLQISPNPSGLITVSPNAAGLSAGTYAGQIQVTSSQLPGGSAIINVSLTVTATPALITIPQGLVFTWGGGAASLPAAQSVTLTTTNGSAVAFTVGTSTSSGGNWLSVNTGGSNTAPTAVTISANPSGLGAGVYTGTITFNTSGTANPSQSVDVRLIVTSGTGTGTGAFQFNPGNLRFFAQPNGAQPPNQQVQVTTTGLATNYLVTTQVTTPAGGNWLQAGPASGQTPGSISVGVSPFGLSNGTYTGTVTVSGGGQSSSFGVELVITNNPLIVTSTRAINFNHQVGAAVPVARTVAVTSSNNQSLNYSAAVTSSNTPWVSVTQPTFGTPGVFSVNLVPSAIASLSAGQTYNAIVTVTANGADNSPLQIPVTLNLSPNPQLILSSNSPVTFNAAFNGVSPPSQALTVSSTTTALNVTAVPSTTSGGNWLQAQLNTTSTPATLTISALSTGLSTGVYNGLVTVTASTGVNTTSTVTIPVTLTVSSQPLLNVTPRELNFGGAGNSTQQQTINISSTIGNSSYSVGSSVATPFGGNWLQVNATQATGVTPGAVQISVQPAGLADGTYFGLVTVSATGVANSPVIIPVTLTVNNATALFVSPNDVTFSVQQGGVLPQAQAVSVTSQISTAFIVTTQPGAGTTSANWLDVSPTSGLTNAILTVRPNSLASTLQPGRYIAVVTVSGTGSPNTAQFNVTMNVAPSITLAASPTSLNFTGRERSTANPPAQTFTVSAGGSSANIIATPTTSTGGNWLTVTPTNGTTGVTNFNVSVNVGSLAVGSYSGSIQIALSTAATTPLLTIPVSFTVERSVPPNITSIANGASFQPGALAPGLIVSLFGTGLGPDTGQSLQVSGGRVTRSVAGVRVLFDGIEAPILFVRADQINCVVPYAMTGRAQATVQVDNNGVLSNTVTPRINDTAPAIFSLGGTQAAMLNQNNSVNGASNPADRGSIGVLYMTGEGALTPPGVDGEVTQTIKRPIAPVSIRVGGIDVTNIAFVGAAPGLVQGVLQINFTIPSNAPVGGSIPIEVNIGGVRSQSNMTIAVR